MRSTADGRPGPEPGLSSNNNNNGGAGGGGAGEPSDTSGCRYALCALGVGLVALGIVMIVWSVVPADAASNSSSVGGGGANTGSKKNKVSSVAAVLVGCGVILLLLALGLGLMSKQREQQRLRAARNQGRESAVGREEGQSAEDQAQRYAVPTYEEAVGSGRYPVRLSGHRPSSSQLPSYDDLLQVDGVEYECEGSEVTGTGSRQATAATTNPRPGKSSRKLLPISIRRIKSEKLHEKNLDHCQPAPGISIEPLTPPPQYDDKGPPL